jgi:hypothetical protein
LNFTQFKTLQSLQRNYFPGELFWRSSQNCSGYSVNITNCELRIDEMVLVAYTPKECLDTTPSLNSIRCRELVAYARINNKP